MLIALAEFMSILCLVIARTSSYKRKILDYSGDNQNVVGWVKFRRPKNRVAQYITRILNRLESEHDCVLFPCYISSGSNTFCGDLSRLSPDEGRSHGVMDGFAFVDIIDIFQWFLTERIRTLSLILPSGNSDRVNRIMQFVEKRRVRYIPSAVKNSCKVVFLGVGTNSWLPAVKDMGPREFREPSMIDWVQLTDDTHLDPRFTDANCVVLSLPSDPADVRKVSNIITGWDPNIVVFDAHPKRNFPRHVTDALRNHRTNWSWELNTSALGSPQSRLRSIHVSVLGKVPPKSQMAILYLLEVYLPLSITNIMDYKPIDVNLLEGDFQVKSASPVSVFEPTGLGYIHIPRDRVSLGVRWQRLGVEYVVKSANKGKVVVRSPLKELSFNLEEGKCLPTNYQVFSPHGVSFPVSTESWPSGIGHTLIFDSSLGRVRSLSMMECWLLQGGAVSDYPRASASTETVNRILEGTQPALQLYLAGLAVGTYFHLSSHEDFSGLGATSHTNCHSNTLRLMPGPRRPQYTRPDMNTWNRRNDRTRHETRAQRGNSRRDFPRLETISRNLIRLLRHGPRRGEQDLHLNRSDGGSVALDTLAQHPTFTERNATFDEINQLVGSDEPSNKLRFDVYNAEDGARMVRAYNGHSLDGIIRPGNATMPLTQPFIIHGTTLENAKLILSDGLRLLGDRRDHHFVDSTYSQRQHLYLRSSSAKEVWLVFDVSIAENIGCAFTKLRNEVIISSGVDGFIPGSAINSCRNRKRQYLDSHALQQDPPRMVVTPPEGAHHPAHTDDDPSADHLIPIASDSESSIPPNQTARRTPSVGRPNTASTATSKSSPVVPVLNPNPSQATQPSRLSLPSPARSSTRFPPPATAVPPGR